MADKAVKKSKSPKLLCLYVGEQKKAELVATRARLGYENDSEFVRTLFDVAGALTRAQVAKIRAKATREGITPAEYLSRLVG